MQRGRKKECLYSSIGWWSLSKQRNKEARSWNCKAERKRVKIWVLIGPRKKQDVWGGKKSGLWREPVGKERKGEINGVHFARVLGSKER